MVRWDWGLNVFAWPGWQIKRGRYGRRTLIFYPTSLRVWVSRPDNVMKDRMWIFKIDTRVPVEFRRRRLFGRRVFIQ